MAKNNHKKYKYDDCECRNSENGHCGCEECTCDECGCYLESGEDRTCYDCIEKYENEI